MSWIKTGESSFSSVISTSIDNCFSAEYNHYIITRNFSASSANYGTYVRLRSGGIDDTSTNYRLQAVGAESTSVYPGRGTGLTSWNTGLGYGESSSFGFGQLKISNPFNKVRTTAWTDMSWDADGNIGIYRHVWSHDLPFSYNGISITMYGAVTMTGTITVYGLKES